VTTSIGLGIGSPLAYAGQPDHTSLRRGRQGPDPVAPTDLKAHKIKEFHHGGAS
jgi:hypothetical protein